MKNIILTTLAILILAGCNKDFVLNVDKTSLSFEATGGSQKIKITSDVFWDIVGNGEDWYSLSVTEGEGNATVEINVKEYGEAAGRTAELTISGGSTFRTLTLVQVRPPLPQNPSELKYNINSLEQELEIEVPEIYAYKVEEGASFAKVVKTEKGKFTLKFEENTTGKSREATFAVKTSDDMLIETAKVVQTWRSIEPGELLIEEVFFTGALIPGSSNSDSSDGDQYFRLTNNTNKTVYADRLLIVLSKTDSQATTTGAIEEYPSLPDSLGVSTVYQIPGQGKDVAVAPGKSLIIALSAQNFNKDNKNGMDLSKADFEFYDENEAYPDTDNPDVANLERWFTYSQTLTGLHDRGYQSYAIAIPPANVNNATFIEKYKWTGKYIFKYEDFNMEFDIEDAYLIPNSWVLDGINCAVEEHFNKLAWNPSTDTGYTYCGKVDKDPTRFGKSVRRKKENGKLKDTNNSTNDFTHEAKPSLKK